MWWGWINYFLPSDIYWIEGNWCCGFWNCKGNKKMSTKGYIEHI